MFTLGGHQRQQQQQQQRHYHGMGWVPILQWQWQRQGKFTYVSLRLPVQNAVPAQPCVGKIQISLVLFNFLHCNFRSWFETP